MSEADLYEALLKEAETAAQSAGDSLLSDTNEAAKGKKHWWSLGVNHAERDCVRVTDVPDIYEANTKMITYSGICGYMYQITNKSPDTPFTVNFLVEKGAFHALSALSALAAALAFF